jgi:lipopolysaccharide export system protein LptA
MKNITLRLFLFLLLVAVLTPLFGQQGAPKRTIHIIFSNNYYYEDLPTGRQEWLGGEVKLRHDSSYLFSDTAHIFGAKVDAVGNTSIVQGDSLTIFADTLTYDSQSGMAWLVGRVLLLNGDQQLVTDRLQYDTRTRVATYATGAWLTNAGTKIYSVRGDYNVGLQTVFFKDSVQIQSPEFKLKADSMSYNVREDRAYFTGPTRIKQPKADLYCEGGYYSMAEGYGLFEKNAQFADSTRQATADQIYYNNNTQEIRLIGQADYREQDRQARGDTLVYREKTGDFLIRGNGFLVDGKQTIQANGIDYNTKTERFQTIGRSELRDGSQVLTADQVYNTDSTDLVQVKGNVIMQDTSAQMVLRADSAEYQRSLGYFKAMGNPPMLENVIDGDTLYMIADVIISKRSQGQDSSRYIYAYPNVFLYKSDLQVICDSLVYNEQDSLFSFYNDPVVWSDTSQFTADTIAIRLKNQQIDSIYLLKNAFIVNTVDSIYYNQIKGRNITAAFLDNTIHDMFVNGNAETIYYAIDDQNAYIGVNKSECSDMVLLFETRQVKDIYYLKDPKSIMYPMSQVNHEQLRLAGFKWRENEKPLSLEDILNKWMNARALVGEK